MAEPSIDYDALAQQHGGSAAGLDYDSLARQHGGAPGSSRPSVGGFFENVLNSAGRMVRDVYGAVSHPQATLAGVTGLLEGMAEKSGSPPVAGVSHQQNVDALVKLYKDRYGSVEDFAKTLYEDPVGVMADVATLAGAAGMAAKGVQAGTRVVGLAKAADAAGQAAKAAGAVADVTDPLALAGKGIRAAAGRVLDPEKLYLGALKPPPSWYGPEEARQIARTGLNERVLVSEVGLQKLYDKIAEVNKRIHDTISHGAARGATIDPESVALRVDQLKPKFRNQVNASEDLEALEASKQQWRTEQGARPATPPQPTGIYNSVGSPIMTPGAPAVPARPIPADQAQAIKQGTYARLKGKYGETKSASIEAQKALARGIKEELVNTFPEIAALNARDSRLINLEDTLERAVRRIGNHQIFGIGTPIAAAGVGAATGSPKIAAIAGAMRAVLENPQAKSALAIALNSGKNPATGRALPAATAVSRVQEYLDELSGLSGQ